MAEDQDDPREVAWHPRFAPDVVGQDVATAAFTASFASGRPHHAWLMTGSQGIGKASLAYKLARYVLSHGMKTDQVDRWVHSRAHPDLAVLERSLNDSKPRKLKTEISVDDVRRFIDFFSRTSGSGGWRVGLVDAADDLNSESANALLKLVEEPPAKALILLVCHAPGKLLRTLRSRCRRLPLAALTIDQTTHVLQRLPIEPVVASPALEAVARISGGSPGFALQLLNSEGAKAFQAFKVARRLDAATRAIIGQHFATRAAAVHDYEIFMGLLLGWLARQATEKHNVSFATLHAELAQRQGIVSGYNLDRRVAVMEAMAQVDQALKVA